MTEPEPADLPPLNEETPPLDASVAVEWWHEVDENEGPRLDTFHGFHDAERVADGDPPAVTHGEVVTESGVRVDTGGSLEDEAMSSRYPYLTHQEALERGISPCIECFPAYATERRVAEEEGEDGILAELGVEGVVFALWTRHDQESGWDIDSMHESYTSMLYRARAIRARVGSVGGRLRRSYMPIRQCDYASFEEAMEAEPRMPHVSELRPIQPGELPAVREQVGDDSLQASVKHEHRVSDRGDMKPPVVHEANDPPCGYEHEFNG